MQEDLFPAVKTEGNPKIGGRSKARKHPEERKRWEQKTSLVGSDDDGDLHFGVFASADILGADVKAATHIDVLLSC